ncbi:LOW QUALITY PROTEIN: methylesterase 17-like [Primulina eburnea]|uniref:LOW QUALITY PROTEIN: methylesterase 17-like n=1 Tax=Primulina eburnea TaxID=1245227 RepID=UPI003C6C9CB3
MGEELAEGLLEINENSLQTAITPTPEAHFVLIHGIGGGAWCWYKIKCVMENSGHRVTCLDLTSAGIDQTDPNTVLSFQDYNRPLVEFLQSLEDGQQVILVGHSAGGLSVSEAIHKFGRKIKAAVFVGATMLKCGFASDEDVKDGVPDVSEFGELDEVYDLWFGLGQDHPPTSVMVKKQLQRKLIYHMSPQEDSCLAAMLLKPGPIQALQSATFTETEDSDKVPRIYIKTSRDRILRSYQQNAMIKKWQPSKVYTLESDHSPFFSAPLRLIELLVKVAVSRGYGE